MSGATIPEQTQEQLDAELRTVFGWDDEPVTAPEPAAPATPVPAPAPAPTPPEVQAAVPSAEPEAVVSVAPAPAASVTPPVATIPATGTPAENLPPLEPQPVVAPIETEAERNLRFANTEAQLAAATAELARVRQEPQQAVSQQTGITEQPEQVSYELRIPDEVSDAILGEDLAVSKHGLQHLVNSLATVVHTRVRAEFVQQLESVKSIITSKDQQEQEQRADAARTALQQQYFAKFPEHSKPVLSHILYAQAQKLSAEYPAAVADDNYFNALGARVNAAIAEINGQQVAPATVPAVPAQPAAMMPTSARTSIPVAKTLTAENELMELFSDEFE